MVTSGNETLHPDHLSWARRGTRSDEPAWVLNPRDGRYEARRLFAEALWAPSFSSWWRPVVR